MFLGNGNGTFQPAHNLSFASYTYPSFVVAADFNGDGKPDLAVLTDKLWVAMGKGDGTFAPATSYTPGQGLLSAAVLGLTLGLLAMGCGWWRAPGIDPLSGLDSGIPGPYQFVQRGIWAELRIDYQYRHAQWNEPVPRRSV